MCGGKIPYLPVPFNILSHQVFSFSRRKKSAAEKIEMLCCEWNVGRRINNNKREARETTEDNEHDMEN